MKLNPNLQYYFFARWNQLDVAIVLLSVLGIVLEEMKSDLMPINPTIMRVMRVLRIARGIRYLRHHKPVVLNRVFIAAAKYLNTMKHLT